MATVFVEASSTPREISRSAANPYDHAKAVEQMADRYSSTGRLVRVYVVTQHAKPWRKQSRLDAIYESLNGQATSDYRPVSA